MYNVKEPNTIILFGFKTDFGGGKSSGFGLIYDDIDTVKKFEPKHRLIPLNLKKKPALNRKQRKERKNKAKKFRGIRKYVGQKRQHKKIRKMNRKKFIKLKKLKHEEKVKLENEKKEPLKLEEKRYLISKSWYDKWEQFLEKSYSQKKLNPGEIDNSNLIQNNKLKRSLNENLEYVIVNENLWKHFESTFSGGPEIIRNVIKNSNTNQLEVEVYPLVVEVKFEDQIKSFEMSKEKKVSDLKEIVAEHFKVNPDEYEFSSYYEKIQENTQLNQLLKEERLELKPKTKQRDNFSTDYTLSTLNLDMAYQPNFDHLNTGQTNFMNPELSFLGNSNNFESLTSEINSEINSYSLTNTTIPTFETQISIVRKPTKGFGLVGLVNIGNSCYMNSGLQCLLNIEILKDHFLTGKYKSEINKNNPIGTSGEVTDALVKIYQKSWDAEESEIVPENFKKTFGKFSSQFANNSQQDCQEFLSVLLDKVHEDLNRVKIKPQTERVEGFGKKDQEVADLSWVFYIQRNDSIISDHFIGQFKSKIYCPKCKSTSITFDPLMFLSLPLPSDANDIYYFFQIQFFYQDPDKFSDTYLVTSKKHLGLQGIFENLSTQSRIDEKHILLTQVENGKITKTIKSSDNLRFLNHKELLFAFEVKKEVQIEPDNPYSYYYGDDDNLNQNANNNSNSKKQIEYSNVQVCHKKLCRASEYFADMIDEKLFGVPMVISFEEGKKFNSQQIYDYILKYMKKFLTDELIKSAKEMISQKNKKTPKKTQTDNYTSWNTDSLGIYSSNYSFTDNYNDVYSLNSQESDEIYSKWKFKKNVLEPYFKIEVIFRNSHNINLSDSTSNMKIGKQMQIMIKWNPNLTETVLSDSRLRFSIITKECEDYQKKIQEENSIYFSLYSTHKPSITIDQCFDKLLAEEKLGKTDMWYCPKCKDFIQAI
ncbi:ubiquitin carboxyl-terminal hydrolase 10-related [Anaeramoeba ignava]|uniref:Ubiquitin carboxyl-terminal hydrolase 10-related n=1 Tax=Anaeramoeba ignava TaxID=1746090 RepID=A0A9Q0RAT7_ANAIG|nr:ubiquitin carboxyl-terminal hydrolase 10-related [Anaeramoeba ignava]